MCRILTVSSDSDKTATSCRALRIGKMHGAGGFEVQSCLPSLDMGCDCALPNVLAPKNSPRFLCADQPHGHPQHPWYQSICSLLVSLVKHISWFYLKWNPFRFWSYSRFCSQKTVWSKHLQAGFCLPHVALQWYIGGIYSPDTYKCPKVNNLYFCPGQIIYMVSFILKYTVLQHNPCIILGSLNKIISL